MLNALPTTTAFVAAATNWCTTGINQVLAKQEYCLIALSGGNTPIPVYQALATQPIDWSRVGLCLVDERHVPSSDQNSNTKLIQDNLIKQLPTPPRQIIVPNTQLEHQACAYNYHTQLQPHPADLAIIGLGEDGHTASLFPPVPADAFSEQLCALATTQTTAVSPNRISVTLPYLQRCQQLLVLLQGPKKLQTWQLMQNEPYDPTRWPLQALLPHPHLTVLVTTT